MKMNIYMNGELSVTIELHPQELDRAKRSWVSEGDKASDLIYEVFEPTE